MQLILFLIKYIIISLLYNDTIIYYILNNDFPGDSLHENYKKFYIFIVTKMKNLKFYYI